MIRSENWPMTSYHWNVVLLFLSDCGIPFPTPEQKRIAIVQRPNYTSRIVTLLYELLYELHESFNSTSFLADRTIGRAFSTLCRLSVCLSYVCCLC